MTEIIIDTAKTIRFIFAAATWLFMLAYALDVKARMRTWLGKHENAQPMVLCGIIVGAVCTAFALADACKGTPLEGFCNIMKYVCALLFMAVGVIAKFVDHERSRGFFERHKSARNAMAFLAYMGFGELILIICTT